MPVFKVIPTTTGREMTGECGVKKAIDVAVNVGR